EDGIRDFHVTGVQTCALPILTVSPTLHPANITSIDGYDAAKGYVADAVTTLDAAHQSVAHVIEARQKVNLDESRTPRAKVLMTEIGRASCRERGQISVDAGAM